MKRIAVFGMILSLLVPIFTTAEKKVDKEYDELEILSHTLEEFEADFLNSETIINGIILERFIQEKEANILGNEVLSKLNIMGKEVDPLLYTKKNKGDIYTKEVIFEENYSQISYEGFDENNNHISIILSSYLNEDNSSGETYLCINIINGDDFSGINDIMEKIKLIFRKYDSAMDIAYCLLGKLEKQYSNEDINGKIYRLTKDLRGNIIDEYADDGMTSYTMYIPNIKDYIEIDKKKINLNVAIRYNEYENNTYLWIGTPIITTGY